MTEDSCLSVGVKLPKGIDGLIKNAALKNCLVQGGENSSL